jgi:hypothetical protein
VNTLPDHAALKLGKGTADLKHQLACPGAIPTKSDDAPPLPAALCYCISNRTTCIHNVRQLAVCLFFIIERMSRSNAKVASRLGHSRQ